VDEGTGRYARDRYVASFAGFAPVDNPQIACIVSIDEPRGKYYGGDVAAPVFAQVSLDVLKALGVEPAGEPPTGLFASDLRSYEMPQVLVESERNESELGAVDGREEPLSSAANLEGSRSEDAIRVPVLIGKGIREATEICATRGLKIVAAGDGLVARQVPPAGALVQPGTTCQVTLSINSEGKVRSAAVPVRWGPQPATGSN